MSRILIALTICALPAIANAATVNVTASGTIFLVEDPGSLLPFGDLMLDSTIATITFSYDPAADDQITDPGIGSYPGATDFTIDINGVRPDVDAGPGASIFIRNDQPQTTPVGWHVDGWGASSDFINNPGNQLQLSLTRNEDAPTTPPLTSDALVDPDIPGGWEFGFIIFRIQRGPVGSATTVAELYANVDSLSTAVVPIPAAAWLFGSALGLLAWIRRRAL